MQLTGLTPGTRLVTSSGDVVELLDIAGGGASARVRYLEVLDGGSAKVGTEVSVAAEDIATVEGTRFIGPGRTASSSRT